MKLQQHTREREREREEEIIDRTFVFICRSEVADPEPVSSVEEPVKEKENEGGEEEEEEEEEAPPPLPIKTRKPKKKGRKLPSKNLLAARAREEVRAQAYWENYVFRSSFILTADIFFPSNFRMKTCQPSIWMRVICLIK